MKKVPTLYLRDPADMRRVLREVHPDCTWVFAGWGTPTRKYDGVCTMFDGERWWARREVKRDGAVPAGFVAVDRDEATGKTQGWEPMEQSGFARWHAEALDLDEMPVLEELTTQPIAGATYELVGPRINGNPERLEEHILVRHGYRAWCDRDEFAKLTLDYDGIAAWLDDHGGGDDHAHTWEGIVWHHPDGRMAKIKRRDFPRG
jgi:hypothetical protein